MEVADAPLKLSCRGCGASLEYSATDVALRCQYCATLTEIESEEEAELPDAPQLIIPLSVDEAKLTERVFEHLATGDLTPDHLLEHATFTQKDRFYAPAYVFHGSYEAQWTASFGYDRTEHYTVYENRTENGHTRQVPVTKTRTVTDWRPVNGNDSGRFAVRAYAGNRLAGATVDAINLVEATDLPDPVAYNPKFATGISSEAFTQSDDDAYQARAKAQVNAVIDAGVSSHAQGDRQRDWHWTASIRKQATTLLVPVCHVVFEFEGKAYNVWLSGADSNRMLADPLPVDEARKKSLSLGTWPLMASAVSGGLAVFKFDAGWALPLIGLVGTAVYAGMRHNAIVGHSKALRQALLASRRAAASNTAQLSNEEQQALLASAKRPMMPKFVSAGVDKMVLTWATVAALVLPGLQLGGEALAERREKAQDVAQALPPQQGRPVASSNPPVESPRSAPAPTPTPPPVAAEPDAATVATAAAEPATATANGNGEGPTAAATTAAPAGAESTAPTLGADTPVQQVAQLLRASAAMEWGQVDEQVARIKANPPGFPPGDRKQARAANNEGLALLKGGNAAQAAAAFQRGVALDVGDIEVRNNLAYALVKAGEPDKAIPVLAQVLMQAPDRTSAWANLAEALDKPGASHAALRIAVRHSANREKTLAFLRSVVENPPNERFAATAAAVLAEVNDIPRHPKDTSSLDDGSAGRL